METLTPAQNLALCLLASGYSTKEVAEQAGVTSKTIERWKSKPNFEKLLRDAIAKTYDAAVAELCSGARDAAKELKRIINDPDVPSRTKVTAISVLLSNASKAKDTILEERLERVENSLDGTDSGEDSTN